MTEKLTDARRAEVTPEREAAGWEVTEDALTKSFVFRNFVEAWGFMSQCAIWAEKLNHHPEWSNVYKTVEVKLTTHDVDGLSELDVRFAEKMDELSRA